MHSTVKNSKFKQNCGVEKSEDEKYDEDFEEAHCSKKNNKKFQQLFVEMNDSVRNILSSPNKCNSALLDVAVIIKSTEGVEDSAIEINTLKGPQVKKFLANLDREKRDKRLLNDIFEDKAPSEDTVVRISKHNPKRKMQAASELCYRNARERKFVKSQLHRPNRVRTTPSSARVDNTCRKHIYNQCYSPGIMQITPMIGESCMKPDDDNIQSEDSCYEDDPPSTSVYKCGDHKKTHHIYAAPRTFKDLNSIITCQSMSKDDRGPCLCDHCGIASLLSETQKRPIITAPVEHVSDLRRRMNRKEYKEGTKHEYRKRKQDVPYLCEDKSSVQAGMAHLFERIKVLEDRIEIQEERAVPKDYFKRIITKIISHFSPKSRDYRNDNFQVRDSESNSFVLESRYKNNYSVNTLIVDKKDSHKIFQAGKSENHENLKKFLSNLTENIPENKRNEFAESFWKWGGEVLKPGVDLKNMILSLLDMNKDAPKKDDKSENRSRTQDKSKDIKETRNSSSNRSITTDQKDFNSEAFKSFVEAMSNKLYKSHKKTNQEQSSKHKMDILRSSGPSLSDSSLYKKLNRENNDQKLAKKSMIPKMAKKENDRSNTKGHEVSKNLDISYMNPKMSTWQEEESQISFRLEFSDADTNSRCKESKNRELEKLEFLRTLSRTKDSDKEKLWESIWSQAKANGQSKQDKVTIQLPRKNGSDMNDMIEIEFTIGEIEYMLTKHKYADKNKVKS